jgi:hypothetical protein
MEAAAQRWFPRAYCTAVEPGVHFAPVDLRASQSGQEAARTPFRGLPHPSTIVTAEAAAILGRSPCRRPSRDAQTEDLRSPTSTGLGRGVAAPFARRRPNRECALTRWVLYMQTTTQRHSAAARPAAPFGCRTRPQRHSIAARLAAPFGLLAYASNSRTLNGEVRRGRGAKPYDFRHARTRSDRDLHTSGHTRTVQWSRKPYKTETCNKRGQYSGHKRPYREHATYGPC